MTKLRFKNEEDRGYSHSSLENKRKAAKWIRRTLNGSISTALDDTELTKFEIEALVRNALKESKLEVFDK